MKRWRDRARPVMLGMRRLGEKLGVHVLPIHFYSQQPSMVELERTRSLWARPSKFPGVDIDPDRQLDELRQICAPFQSEYEGNAAFLYGTEHGFGRGYGYTDAQALWGFVRHLKPRRLIEVGSGVSTYCAYNAAELNRKDGTPCDITCVEPYPRPALRTLPVRLIDRPAQTVPIETFTVLGEHDILFIDSSHAVRVGSDVNYLMLEVIPRLGPGVYIHIHDIHFPYDYSPAELQAIFFHWSETTLVRALLTNNPHLEVVASMSQMHHERPEQLRQIFPDYQRRPTLDGLFANLHDEHLHFPSSLWLRTK